MKFNIYLILFLAELLIVFYVINSNIEIAKFARDRQALLDIYKTYCPDPFAIKK